MKTILAYTFAAAMAFGSCQPKENLPEAATILDQINLVNQHWQAEHPLKESGELPFHPYSDNSPFWHNAAYHTGNIEAYRLTHNEDYLNYSMRWAEAAQWMGATSTDTTAWRYNYGESPEFVLFGDWQICFQTYADLYNMKGEERMIARAREVMEYEMSTEANDYWWWADGLYMVMPVMVKLGNITGNELYGEKLFEYWTYAKNLMYDTESHLFYRDGKYLYPKHQTESGKKDFWARGDGWVLASLARCLNELPADYAHRDEFTQTYLEMAAAVAAAQQPEGYWTRSMLDPEQAPGPETSGTAFFTYGLLWGIRNGLLPRQQYLPVALKAWEYLTTKALQADGRLGYVQPIGERAIPGQMIDANSTANFGVGAFLLAGVEMYRLVTENK